MTAEDETPAAESRSRHGRVLRVLTGRRRSEPPPSLDETAAAPPPPIGRGEELETFQRLAGIVGRESTRGVALAVVGAAGSGTRSLLDEFAREAQARPGRRCAPVLDLADPPALAELLEQLALGLDPQRDVFKPFFSTLSKFRYREERGRTRAMEYAEAGRTVTTAAHETVPTLATGVANVVGTAVPAAVGAIERPRGFESVKRDFLRGLGELAARDRSVPLVLLFDNLDRRPDQDETASWVRKRLLAEATANGALVVFSVETDEAVDRLPREVPRITMALNPLMVEDAFAFVESRLKISPRTRLAREIIEASEGYPDRLGRFEAYFNRYPDARKEDALPEDARVWAAGGSILEPFERLEPAAARRLVLCASALRRFNEPLLRAVADVAGIPNDARSDAVATLLDSRTRPPWIAVGPDGWAITPQIRRPLIDEFRRLDPALLRAVHDAALRYHHDTLAELDGRAASNDDPHVFAPRRYPAERFANGAYVAAFGDWLYHLAALAPDAAFEYAMTEAVDAIFEDKGDVAVRILDMGPGAVLPAQHDAYRRALADVAAALRDSRYADAMAAIERLAALEPADEFLRVAVDHLGGQAAVNLGWPSERAVKGFEAAETRLCDADDERRLRVRALNLTWLAYHGAALAGRDEAAAQLRTVEEIADRLGDTELQAEARRIRAHLFLRIGDADLKRALREFDAALAALSTVDAPRSVAQVLVGQAEALRKRRDLVEGRGALDRAAQIARSLDDPDLEAFVLAEMVQLELAARDREAATARAKEAVAARPHDPYVHNSVGLAYVSAYEELDLDEEESDAVLGRAVDAYSSALSLSQDPVFVYNRGYARRELARLRDDATQLREAANDLNEAIQRGIRDPELLLDTAELWHKLGDARAASEHARGALELAVGADGLPRTGDPAAGVPDKALSMLERAVALVRGDLASVLETYAHAYPDDAYVHYLLGLARRDERPRDLDRAADSLLRALDLVSPDDGSLRAAYLAALADVLCEAGNLEDAEARAREALDLDPDNGQAEAVKAHVVDRRRRDRYDAEGEDIGAFLSPIRLELGEALVEWIDPRQSGDNRFFDTSIPTIRRRIAQRTGFDIPGVRVASGRADEPFTARLLLHGMPRHEFVLPGVMLAGAPPHECAETAGVDAVAADAPWDGSPVAVVDEAAVPPLTAAGIPVWDPAGAVAATLERLLETEVRSLVTVDYAAWTAHANDWPVEADVLPALTEILRDLAGAGLPAHALSESIREDGLDGARRHLETLLQERRDGWPAETPDGAEVYALSAVVEEAEASVVVRIRLPEDVDQVTVTEGAERSLRELAEALSLPRTRVEVERGLDLPRGAFTVTLDGDLRVAATVEGVQALSPRYCGATSVIADDPGAVVIAALEAALLDDPGLLLPRVKAVELANDALEGSDVEGDADAWAAAIRRVVAARVPLGTKLGDAIMAAAGRIAAERGGRGGVTRQSRPRRPIPDGVPLGIRETLTFEEGGRVVGVRVSLMVRHTDPSDLKVRLYAPDGSEALLHDQGFVLGRDLRLTLQAPESSELEPLLGSDAGGDWTLQVQDLVGVDAGVLVSWSLELELEGSPARPTLDGTGSRNPLVIHTMRAERLMHALRPYEVEVRLGHDVAAAIRFDDQRDGPDPDLLLPLQRLLTRVGLPLARTVKWRRLAELEPNAYEIVANGLRRARGEAPAGSVFVPAPTETNGRAANGHAHDPRTGRPGIWLAPGDGEAGRVDLADSLSAADFVVADVNASLVRAAAEFADVGWTEQFLDGVAAWAPLLVSRLRAKYPVEVLAATLARLTEFGVSIRDSRIFDCLLEVEDEDIVPDATDAAAAADPDRLQTPEVLAEHVARVLAETIAYVHVGADADAVVIELDPASEAPLRAAVRAGEWPEPVYGFEGSSAFLRTIEQRLRTVPGDRRAILATSADLRRHVRRLVAAQFPGLTVLTVEQR